MSNSTSPATTASHPIAQRQAYEEMVDLIASGATPQNLIAFRPSPGTMDRVRDLLSREKTLGLSDDETSELDHYVQLEHIMRLVKARAQHYADDVVADPVADREAS